MINMYPFDLKYNQPGLQQRINMEDGWIKLHRKIQNNGLWDKKPFSTGQAWIDLLLSANHKDKKFIFDMKLIEVKRGSFITSIKKLCERWGWSNTKVINFLNLLENDSMILRKSDAKKTVLSIVNYSNYQSVSDTETTQKHSKNDTEAILKHTNKNEKNNNKALSENDYIEFVKNNFKIQTNKYIDEYKKAYPHLDISKHLNEAYLWLISHTDKKDRKSRFATFCTNWLKTAASGKYEKINFTKNIELEKRLAQVPPTAKPGTPSWEDG